MMPLLAIIRIRHRHGGFSIWAPVILLWLLIAVLGVILSPLLAVCALAQRRNPVAVAATFWWLVFALKGTLVEVEAPASSVLVRLI
jgi:hypothetical protein